MHQLLLGSGSAPGTCGELIHGITGDGKNVHVTLPINWYSHVNLRLRPADEWSFASDGPEAAKLRAGIRASAEILGVGPFDVTGRHHTTLDTGKGLAASTADILAGSRAFAHAVLRTLTPEQEAYLATGLERADGTMYPGVVALDQSTGRIVNRFPWWPQFAISMVVPDATATAADFTGKDVHGPDFDEMLRDLSAAARSRDGLVFATAATRSALLNQEYSENEWFPLLDGVSQSLGGDGVVIGHTGTVAGLLFLVGNERHSARGFGPAFRKARNATRALRQMLPSDVSVHTVRSPAHARPQAGVPH